ncbi:hypothetical protein DPMN_037678 [Dreissena polymorpha]|uniref:Uncharacterized protein n=1 Tax=Dreissena polymorpha TaxID=45954 RepID=A0A9D4MEY9_DREPO|nr:hypothetical protein DPMN_037678 [Dreissena polymorpha]
MMLMLKSGHLVGDVINLELIDSLKKHLLYKRMLHLHYPYDIDLPLLSLDVELLHLD